MPVLTDAKKIEELLTRGVAEVIEQESLRKKLSSGKALRIKFGIDPTGSDLHLGHAVALRKLRQFQDLGHQVILLIGDYTAMVGDPTGRNETRPMLSESAIADNMKTYIAQASKVLDMSTLEIRHNSEWFKPAGAALMMELTGKITVARILERDDFQKRLKEGSDIHMQEILYPLLQGYDSVMLKADVELGGTDQKFNLLMGRKLQKRYDQAEQDVMTVPLLVGTDGEKKMSKSYGNYIAFLDTPNNMFGKVMSVPDALIRTYFELVTDVSLEQILSYHRDIASGANPLSIKMKLAEELVRLYYGEQLAGQAKEYFHATFQKKEPPTDMAEFKPSACDIITVLVQAKLVKSKSEARQVIAQGGVKVNDVKVESIDVVVKSGDVVQKGNRFFIKIV
jgi:tyrosyl-tRNA synthetase